MAQPWPCPQGATCLPEATATDSAREPEKASQKAIIIGCSVAAALLLAASFALWQYYQAVPALSPFSKSFDGIPNATGPARTHSAIEVSATISPLQGLLVSDLPQSAPIPAAAPTRLVPGVTMI